MKCYIYNESVLTRQNKANEKPIKDNANYRYVILGNEIFPIPVRMVNAYNSSDRKFKRSMKKSYIKMVKKSKVEKNR